MNFHEKPAAYRGREAPRPAVARRRWRQLPRRRRALARGFMGALAAGPMIALTLVVFNHQFVKIAKNQSSKF